MGKEFGESFGALGKHLLIITGVGLSICEADQRRRLRVTRIAEVVHG
jgi:hypothetical protein